MPVLVQDVMPQDNTALRQKLAEIMTIQNQKRNNDQTSAIKQSFFAQNTSSFEKQWKDQFVNQEKSQISENEPKNQVPKLQAILTDNDEEDLEMDLPTPIKMSRQQNCLISQLQGHNLKMVRTRPRLYAPLVG